jgi:hypothetical protein
MKTIFDVVNNLSYTKKYDLSEIDLVNPVVLNLAFSKYLDCVFYTAELAALELTNEMLYDFYFYAIPAKKRFAKWYKPVVDNDLINFLCSFYSINKTVAAEYAKILSPEQKQYIKKMKGGQP